MGKRTLMPVSVRTIARRLACVLVLGLWLGPAAAQDAAKLTGPVRRPVLCPSNPDLVAYERTARDAQELYLYDKASGTVQQVAAPPSEESAPAAETSFTELFEAAELDRFSRYDGQLTWRPRLDPAGRQWFAFVGGSGSGFDLYLSYVDDRGRLAADPPIHLAFDGLEQFPRWSPDGRTLLFVSGNESGSDLYLLPDVLIAAGRRGAVPTRLTANPDLEAFPAWSPDGQYVAYQTLTTQEGRRNWGISLVQPDDLNDGSVAVPVPLTDALSAYDEFKPSWSPDGQHMAFYVSQARVDEPDSDNLQQDVAVVGVVRSGRRQRIERGRLLTGFSPRLAVNVIPNEGRGPSWMPAPDALQLVYVKRDAPSRFPLYVTDVQRWLNRQPGYEQPLSTAFGTQYHRDPVLAALPNGVRVAFVSQEGGANRLQVFDRPSPGNAEQAITFPIERRRGTALARSLLVPGLGQFYKGQATRGALFLAAEAVALGAGAYFLTRVDAGRLLDLEAAYLRSVAEPGACPTGTGAPCENEAFQEWQREYDSARTGRTLAALAFGTAAGVWLLNVIDSGAGFPRTVDRPIRIARKTVALPTPQLTLRNGTPHYGLRLHIQF